MDRSKLSCLAISLLLALLAAVSCQGSPTGSTSNTQSGGQGDAIKVTLKKVDGTPIEKQVQKPKYGGTLNVRLAQDAFYQGSDPAFMDTAGEGSVMAQGEPLVRGDWARGPVGTGETDWYYWEWPGLDFAKGALAESWEMPDAETTIFHLRKGIRYAVDDREASKLANGREVVADDVVASIKRLYANPIPSNALKDTQLKDISAPDKYTVIVKTSARGQAPFWIFAADLAIINPPEVVQKYGDLKDWRNLVGTGPYMIKEVVPGDHTTWVKNPNYWDQDPVLGGQYKLPYIDTINQVVIPDRSAYVAALRTGKIDLSRGTEDPESAAQMRKDIPRLEYNAFEGGPMTRFAMQLADPSSPFRDIRVRQAMLMAIDYKSIVDKYFKGEGEVVAFPLNNAKEFRDRGWYIPLKDLPQETQDLYGYHPDKAKALLAEAGYPNGFKTSLMIPNNSPLQADLSDMVVDYWAKIGVQVSMDVKDYSTYISLQTNKKYTGLQVAAQWGTPGEYNWFGTGDSRNHSGVSDPKIDGLRDQIFANYWDKQKRTPVMQELFKYTLSQAYYVPMPVGHQTALWNPWVKGWHGESTLGYWGVAIQFAYMWIDQDQKKQLGF